MTRVPKHQQRQQSKPRTRSRTRGRSTQITRADLAPCPYCSVLVKGMERHIRRQHGQANSAKQDSKQPIIRLPKPLVLTPTASTPVIPSPNAVRRPCPECAEMVVDLAKHVRQEHGWRTLNGIVRQRPGRPKPLALCPDCEMPFRVCNLDAHRKKKHASRRATKHRPTTPQFTEKTSQATPVLAAAPHASNGKQRKKNPVSPSEPRTLQPSRPRHHGVATSRDTPGSVRTVAGRKERIYTWDVDRWGSFEQERLERLSDATRGLGFARRENGSWGSTVAYDDYGDESGA